MPLQNDKVLITGTKSGLGKYLSKQFTECFCLNRENKQDVIDKALQIQLIVHCAFNTKRDANTYQLLKDNISELSNNKDVSAGIAIVCKR